MKFDRAPDVKAMVEDIVEVLKDKFYYIDTERIICLRSFGSKARAYARIWSLPKIWQAALDIRTFYVLEVISHHFDQLPIEKKRKVIIHELMHIPTTFSGALTPHNFVWRRIDARSVNRLYELYKKRKMV